MRPDKLTADVIAQAIRARDEAWEEAARLETELSEVRHAYICAERQRMRSLATILRRHLRPFQGRHDAVGPAFAERLTFIARDVARDLAKNNPHFDREKFLTACGVRDTA